MFGPARRPRFHKNAQFGDAMNALTKAHEALEDKQRKSTCLFPLDVGGHCGERAVDGHTVQEALLDRISKKGHVWTFLRGIAHVRERLIDQDSERSRQKYDQRRWAPEKAGVKRASVYHFCCNDHDRSLFRPIEHDDRGGQHHPLDKVPATSEKRTLLTYRIVMLATELLNRTEVVMDGMSRRHRRSRVILKQKKKIRDIHTHLRRAMEECADAYLKSEYDNVVDTPIDLTIVLPIGLAVVDSYAFRNDPRNGQLFVSVLPLGLAHPQGSKAFRHRIIASRMCGEVEGTRRSVNHLWRMIGRPDQIEDAKYELLEELLVHCRNAFFSDAYEGMPDDIRLAIEHSVYEATVTDFPPPLQAYL